MHVCLCVCLGEKQCVVCLESRCTCSNKLSNPQWLGWEEFNVISHLTRSVAKKKSLVVTLSFHKHTHWIITIYIITFLKHNIYRLKCFTENVYKYICTEPFIILQIIPPPSPSPHAHLKLLSYVYIQISFSAKYFNDITVCKRHCVCTGDNFSVLYNEVFTKELITGFSSDKTTHPFRRPHLDDACLDEVQWDYVRLDDNWQNRFSCCITLIVDI